MIGNDTYATHGRLLHLSRAGKTYFVTFDTMNRIVLSPEERDMVFGCALHNHQEKAWIHCCVVMPDHAHIVLTPYESRTMKRIVGDIKSASSHLARRHLWQRESFDHILRSDESLRKKCEYVSANPVRKGLVARPDEWPWLFRDWKVSRV